MAGGGYAAAVLHAGVGGLCPLRPHHGHPVRKTLFGAGSDDTQRDFGFLYLAYGPSAPFWEVEELLRKLILSAIVVLFDSGSPLQV